MRLLLLLLIFSIGIAMLPAYAQSNSAVIQIKNFEFEMSDPYGITVFVYQDTATNLYRTIPLTENPQTISSLPSNHGYIFKVVKNGIDSATTPLIKSFDSPIEILIPNDGGMKFKIKYKDGSPISGAKVVVKSLDNTAWVTANTDSKGETGRYWIQSTTSDSFYYAEVLINDKVSYVYSPVKTQSGLPQDFNIVTPWPKLIDKVDVNIIKDNRKVGTYDGIFLVELYDSKKTKIAQSNVNKGSALFTLLPVDQYDFKVFHKQNQSSTFELWSVHRATLTSNAVINIEQLSQSPSAKNCKCVAFRLDDVQDYFLSASQKAVIQTFSTKSAPLTIGVIGGLIGSDGELVNVIKNNLENSRLEIASHSWNNSPITVFDNEKQQKIIKDTNQKIFDTFGITPSVFIPPENVFDKNTIPLLKSNGITHLSSSFNYDSPPFQLSNSTFYRFPQAAQTAILDSTSNLWIVENRTKIFSDIESSMLSNGFAVVMMHPPEFSQRELGVYKNVVNQNSIKELELLIDQVQAAGYTIVPIGQINLDAKPMLPKPILNEKNSTEIISCNCVAIRIDNVQDFWLNQVQKELLNTFENKKTDVTVGILGKFFGDDPITVQAINSTLNNKKINLDVANSGWEFIDHTKFGVEEQTSSIKKTNDKINSILKKKPSVFIPPLGSFNENTLSAVNSNNLKLVSSNLQLDNLLHSGSKNIVHVPSTLSASDILNDDPFVSGTIKEQAIHKINSNFEKYGYSVISLQVPDFALKEDQISINQIDADKFSKLSQVLDALKENDVDVVTLNSVSRVLWEKSLDIPSWVKNNAEWWSEGTIDDNDFVGGIEYMIKTGIIKIPNTAPSSESNSVIPSWIKNNAGWWSDGLVSDGEFVLGLEYLIKTGIIRVS
ncbi:hypothetical protein C6988_03800 [Nitrosopumilus sp. b1]|uniref:polysaccharide deacetylase family protein n=1 Tax=Nitrosopumilus sp. b1 TaxID=2109907 RepID=UPI0015F51F14|nr:polysaccharide deacetylase family protein [Nitrosopumilus sp. b1]KAF6243377.1 hypothetical protein C6988_03800 [Nitrosopumilus sp. b1]